MMKILLCFMALVFSNQLSAQDFKLKNYFVDTSGQSIEINGSALYGTSTIKNDFSNKFLYGGFIDNDIKNRSLEKHDYANRAGAIAQYDIEYINKNVNLFNWKNWGYQIKAGQFYGVSGAYTKDAFQFLFYGNQSFDKDTIQLKGSEFNTMQFSKIGFGAISKNSNSSVNINFIAVNDFSKAFLLEGEIVDNQQGNVQLNLDGSYFKTQTSKNITGYGVGIDANYNFQIEFFNKSLSWFYIEAQNLGMVKLQNVERYFIDSNYTYNGFRFNQLFGNDKIFNSNTDYADSLNIQRDTINKWIPLPGQISAGKMVQENDSLKWQSFFGVHIQTGFSYVPKVFVGFQYSVLQGWNLGSQISYGGFNKIQFGLYSTVKIKNFRAGIGTENLLGFMSKVAYGNSLNIKLQCGF